MSTRTSNKRKVTRNHGSNSIRNKALFVVAGICIALLFVYFYASFYYKNHFYSNTIINGINATNMTVPKAEEAINSKVKEYRLSFDERNDITDVISSEDINMHTEFEDYVEDLLKKQNSFAWPISLFKSQKYEVNTMLEYDETLLEEHFDQLNCFDEENIQEPVNATISKYGVNGYEIVPEVQGTKVIKDKLFEAVKKAIHALEPTLSIEKSECYEKPEISSEYSELQRALKEMNRIAGAEITYEFGDATEILDGTKISEWISINDDYEVSFITNGVKEYVDYIGKTYNSFGRVRTFQTTYGDEIEVKGGDYGWWLNRPEEVTALTKLIKDGEKVKRDPTYFQIAQQYGKDDVGDTYVEVNLTAQHLFFYKEGKLVLESDFVSGNVSKDFGTPVGTYPVQYKDNDATLVGEDYETPVKYWMPFNKNIGFHDAYWRNEFGKDIYLTRGSHGCINMPPANAKKMYKNIKKGVAVVVYELPGTENYEIDKDISEDSNKEKVKEDTTTE